MSLIDHIKVEPSSLLGVCIHQQTFLARRTWKDRYLDRLTDKHLVFTIGGSEDKEAGSDHNISKEEDQPLEVV